MSAASAAYPQPQVTEANRPLIEAWQRGELRLQQCDGCGQTVYFPRELCPYCWSADLRWSARSGRGTLVSYALVHSQVTEPFASESPVVLGEIELHDGGAMLARVVTGDIGALQSGRTVELVPMPEASRYPLPTFRLSAA